MQEYGINIENFHYWGIVEGGIYESYDIYNRGP